MPSTFYSQNVNTDFFIFSMTFHLFFFFLCLFFLSWCCFCQWDKLGHLIKLEWALWKNEAQILNLAWGFLPLYDCKGDNRPPYLAYRHTHTKEHGTKNAISMQILSTCIKDFHIQCDCVSDSVFTLLNLLIFFIHLTPPPSLHLSVLFVLALCKFCTLTRMYEQRAVLPSCSSHFIYSCDILSFCLIQLSALQGYRCFR